MCYKKCRHKQYRLINTHAKPPTLIVIKISRFCAANQHCDCKLRPYSRKFTTSRGIKFITAHRPARVHRKQQPEARAQGQKRLRCSKYFLKMDHLAQTQIPFTYNLWDDDNFLKTPFTVDPTTEFQPH